MARRLLLAATGAIALAAAGLGTVTAQAAAPLAAAGKISTVHSCARASKGHASCEALARTDAAAAASTAWMATGAKGRVNPNVTPSGFGPGDLQSAYKLPSSSAGAGSTVAIVDAYDDPTAEADLGDLPVAVGLPACTTANGCFKKVNQTGGTTYPPSERRLGAGDLARPRHGPRDLPELPHPAGRGDQRLVANLGTAVNTRPATRTRDQQQLRRQRRVRLVVRRATTTTRATPITREHR